jgi:hypothetical protein
LVFEGTSEREDVEHRKELYAHMGAAMSRAADLEVSLIHALLALDFLSASAQTIKQTRFKNFDRSKWVHDFDEFFEEHQKLSMGDLIKRFAKFAGDKPELVERLKAMLKVRNFLAHHFFREHAASIHNWAGREKMIADLWQAQSVMQEALEDVEIFVAPARKRLRFNEEGIRRIRMPASEQREPVSPCRNSNWIDRVEQK